MLKDKHTIELDKTCELAENSADVYAELAELTLDESVAEKLTSCARLRSQVANDLIVARQQSGELPAAGKPEKAALTAIGMKLQGLVEDTEAMFHSLRDMDLELQESAQRALADEKKEIVRDTLQALIASISETGRILETS